MIRGRGLRFRRWLLLSLGDSGLSGMRFNEMSQFRGEIGQAEKKCQDEGTSMQSSATFKCLSNGLHPASHFLCLFQYRKAFAFERAENLFVSVLKRLPAPLFKLLFQHMIYCISKHC